MPVRYPDSGGNGLDQGFQLKYYFVLVSYYKTDVCQFHPTLTWAGGRNPGFLCGGVRDRHLTSRSRRVSHPPTGRPGRSLAPLRPG